MNKRGVTVRPVILVVFLVMAVVVVAFLGLKAKNVLSHEEYADAYSKITGLTINSMFYSDYDTEVTLNIPSFLNIEIFENKVKVSISETEKECDFIPDNNFKIDVKREGNKLILKKVKK